jgi:hypothetical protein
VRRATAERPPPKPSAASARTARLGWLVPDFCGEMPLRISEASRLPATHAISGLAFAAWVAICAAAPELIWQGLLLLAEHFTLLSLCAIVLIGLVLAFFVEPIMERIRNRRWAVEHQDNQSLVLTAGFAFVFGVAAVALHEGLSAYVGSGEAGSAARQERLVQAIELILQWALIPFAVTLAWFAARSGRTVTWVAGALALAWTVAVGRFYAWSSRDIVMVAIPVVMVLVLGARRIAAAWNPVTFRHLAVGTALVFAGFILSASAAQGLLWLCGVRGWHIYTLATFFEDIRFYAGWSLGIAIAPNPVPGSLPSVDVAPRDAGKDKTCRLR